MNDNERRIVHIVVYSILNYNVYCDKQEIKKANVAIRLSKYYCFKK